MMNQTGMSDNAAGGLAYITFIPAIIFLLVEPYDHRPTVRFHAWQCIYLMAAWIAVNLGMLMMALLPNMRWTVLFFDPLLDLAFVIVWIRVMINAFNGKRIKLPIVGDMAEKRAAV